MSALFVDANIKTPSLEPIPSISTNNWFNVCSPSLTPPSGPLDDLLRPIASISSI